MTTPAPSTTLLADFEAALNDKLADMRRQALVAVFDGRWRFMKFGDLHELLTSPIGKALHDVPLEEVFSFRSPAPPPEVALATTHKAPKASTKKTAKARAKKAGRRSPAGVSKSKAAELAARRTKILEALRGKDWISMSELLQAVDTTESPALLILHKLKEEKLVEFKGEKGARRYRLTDRARLESPTRRNEKPGAGPRA